MMGLRRILSPRASQVWKFRYENPDFLMESGRPHYREITAVAGEGRFRRGSKEEALALAERRLSEQFGQALVSLIEQKRETVAGWTDPAAEKLLADPRIHQDNYHLVSVQRVK
jgi:hypothetical protein